MSKIIKNLLGETVEIKSEEELELENKKPEYHLFQDVLSSINLKHKHIFLEDEERAKKAYNAVVINMCLSRTSDSLPFAVELNTRGYLPARLQYDLLWHGLPAKKRFGQKPDDNSSEIVDMVSEYYNINTKRAKEYVDILTKEQIEEIAQRMNTGEITNDSTKRTRRKPK